MLYALLKIPAQLALPLYCRHLQMNRRDVCRLKGPLLLACNHPNSFLDAIILATLFQAPVHSLARGDAFRKPAIAWLLRQLNILPVYREREGAEHLHKNYHTFDACLEIFRKNGIVLIFSEALCENEWHLRPLKKGTARLAQAAWEAGIPLYILPVGLNYSSFTRFGKTVHLQFGERIMPPETAHHAGKGHERKDVTGAIQQQLQQLVYEIRPEEHELRKRIFEKKNPLFKTLLLALPAAAGWLIHAPLYYPLKYLASPLVKESGHFDSVMVGSLFLAYPFYLAVLTMLTAGMAGAAWWLLVPVVVPFCGWALVQVKKNID